MNKRNHEILTLSFAYLVNVFLVLYHQELCLIVESSFHNMLNFLAYGKNKFEIEKKNSNK